MSLGTVPALRAGFLNRAEIVAQLSSVLASAHFRHSVQMTSLLRCLVEHTLNGEPERLKESVLGVTVFHRHPGYDTQTDPIVRVTMRRLRAKLQQYYAQEGSGALWRIEIPLGAYLPSFERQSAASAPPDSSGARADGAMFRPLSCCPGHPVHPAFSTDGSRIAFQWRSREDLTEGIYVQHLGEDSPVRLSRPEVTELRPAWSPDGSRIARLRRIDAHRFEIVSSSVAGGMERSHGRVRANPGEVPRVDWSPAGDSLLTSERSPSHAPMRLVLIDVPRGTRRTVTPPAEGTWGDDEAVFAPAGRKIAFRRSSGNGSADIHLLDLEGESGPERVAFDARSIRGLCWDGGGRSLIAASSPQGFGSALWSVPLDGSAPVCLRREHDRTLSPAACRTGRSLAYVRQSLETSIWIVATGGYSASTLVVESNGTNRRPEFCPDGSRIAFGSDRTGDDQVWVCDAQGRSLTRLTSLEGATIGTLRWSPDGRAVAFDCRQEASEAILSVDTASLSVRTISPAGLRAISPAWSADGRWLYFATDRRGTWQIWRTPAGGGDPQQITANGGMMALESPDGRSLYYTKGPMGNGLWRKELASGEVHMAADGPAGDMWANWTVGRQGIYWLERVKGRDFALAVRLLDFAGGSPATIAELSDLYIDLNAGISVSPDGQTGLVVHVDRSSSQIMVLERNL